MRVFYVRPWSEAGYGSGDGTSYADAWNGFEAIDWRVLSRNPCASLRLCGAGGRDGFLTVQVDWRYEIDQTCPVSRRESSQPV